MSESPMHLQSTLLIDTQSEPSLRYWDLVPDWRWLRASSIILEVRCGDMRETLKGTSTSTRRCCGRQGGGHFRRRSNSWERDEVSWYLYPFGGVSAHG